jgi:pullulanase/glycogen debranching enzyme
MNLVNNKLRITAEDINNIYNSGAAINYVEIDEDNKGNVVVNIVGDVQAIQRNQAFKVGKSWKESSYGSKITRTFKRRGTPIDMFN